MQNILVITDNGDQYIGFKKLLKEDFFYKDFKFTFCKSFHSKNVKIYEKGLDNLEIIDVKNDYKKIINDFDLIISLHCKQFFPVQLVKGVKCINVHPGYNPINRGWYPQVFAINYNNEVGATIHEIDELLDHGAIIARKKCQINSWDTSLEVYERILELELKLLKEYLPSILLQQYDTIQPEAEGKLYLRKDFKELCKIDLEEEGKFEDFLNRIRSLSHGRYKNAYFVDKDGNKVYLSINLENKN
jgi:dTDP-4-amino-4,6-dideoxyglucose formyltransferase